MNSYFNLFTILLILFTTGIKSPVIANETLSPLTNNEAPQTFDELWKDFDPRKEPLDTEILKEWEEDGVILKILRYRIGIFKGQKAMMAAVYGYPKGAKALPGLVQIHGGGQYADHRAVLTNAKRGYATISISWAGRISAPDYNVSPREVKLFWDKDKKNPNYKATTDWGPLDAYHAPAKYAGNYFTSIPTGPGIFDNTHSPRNNSWFLCTIGARRALTFLEQQAQVNPEKLGVYGHSMGGKITVLTTGSDSRVKAAAPSCGGISDRYNKDPLYRNTVGDEQYLKRINCPIIFLSPSNDFHGRVKDLPGAIKDIKTKDWRITSSPHHNHQDTENYEVATQLWFDQHLKNSFELPETPSTKLTLQTNDGVPTFTIKPDNSSKIIAVDVFYTQQGETDVLKNDHLNSINRFWYHGKAKNENGTWKATTPVLGIDKPLWVYANITYALDNTVTGAGYYYRTYSAKSFTLSSLITITSPQDLKSAGVKASLKNSTIIESFSGDWQKEWFSYRPTIWPIKTHKLYNPQWAAPENARLSIDIQTQQANTLIIGLDSHISATELKGGAEWQTIILTPADFKNIQGLTRVDWKNIKELRLSDLETLRDRKKNITQTFGKSWKGPKPSFRNLKWLK